MPVLVRIAGQIVPLVPHPETSLNGRDLTPTEAAAPVRCACGEFTVLRSEVVYEAYDDDHVGYLDVWYASGHAGPCRACGAQLALRLRFTQRRYRGDSRPDFIYFEEVNGKQ